MLGVSVSGVPHTQDTNWDEVEEEVDEFEDPVAEWFMTSEADATLVIHHHECPASQDERRVCTCTPVTLIRGALA